METTEKTIKKNYIYKGRILNLRNDDVLLPNGKTASREVIEHGGGVCVVALDDDENIYLVSQFRYPYMEEVLEIPAGKLEKNEDPLLCANRELKEETGCTAESYTMLSRMYPSPGYSAEIIYIYLATGIKTGEQRLDEDEFLNVSKIPLEKAVEMVMDGTITDAKTSVGVLKTAMKLSKTKDEEKK